MRLPWGEVWFDIEEGVKLFLLAANIARGLDLLAHLHAQRIPLIGGNGGSLVRVTPTRFGDDSLARIQAHLDAAGLVRVINEIVWELPPSRR